MKCWIGLVLAIPLACSAEVNLVTNPTFQVDRDGRPLKWTSWQPRSEIAPVFDIVAADGQPCLRIKASNFAQFGKWLGSAGPVMPGKFYSFEIEYRPSSLENESIATGAILSWVTVDGRVVQRDYVDATERLTSGWVRAVRRLEAPADARNVTVEMFLRWAPAAEVIFRSPTLKAVDPPAPRTIGVAAPRLDPPGPASKKSNLEFIRETVAKAARTGADLVLLGENLVHRRLTGVPSELAETIPGPITQALAEAARRNRIHIVTSLYERAGDRVYITAVMLDRSGAITGRYRKTHIPLTEAEEGITPGTDYPVFQTEFGRIGLLICWDTWFPETARMLRQKGAELLLVPTTGDAMPHWDVISRARAIDNGIPIAISNTQGPTSRIVNPLGEVLADTSEGIATAIIDLNREYRVNWLSVGPGAGEPRNLYLRERQIRYLLP